MPRGVLTPEQRERQLASLRAMRADPEKEARRLAALRSPETKAKMRAAKVGRPLSEEHRAKIAAAGIGRTPTPATRAKLVAWQKGKPKTPAQLEGIRRGHAKASFREAMSRRMTGVPRTDDEKRKISNTKRGVPQTAEHREAIGLGHARAYAEGRRQYSTLERRASWLLIPLGFTPWPRIGGHNFDFGSADTVVEVNGCRWHDHRPFKPSCPINPRDGVFISDEAYRAVARAAGLKLIELWSCDEANWPRLIGIPGL